MWETVWQKKRYLINSYDIDLNEFLDTAITQIKPSSNAISKDISNEGRATTEVRSPIQDRVCFTVGKACVDCFIS
jgi:hypothetical protein